MGLQVRLRKAVRGFTLDIAWQIGRELAVLFGYSGAGKTMTLQMLAGFVQPDAGCIRLAGTTLYDGDRKINTKPQARSFGYVFQDLALFPHMTVMDNMLYGAAGVKKNDRTERAHYFIREFKLSGLEKSYPHEISGGQKQRVALGRALIRQPKALLLDEPFSALDRPLRLEMRHFLKEIRDRFCIPVVLVTHDFEEAVSVADKMIIYENGAIRQIGTPDEVINAPANRYVSHLVAANVPEN